MSEDEVFEQALHSAVEAMSSEWLGAQEPWFELLPVPIDAAVKTVREYEVQPLLNVISDLRGQPRDEVQSVKVADERDRELNELKREIKSQSQKADLAEQLYEQAKEELRFLRQIADIVSRQHEFGGVVVPMSVHWRKELVAAYNDYEHFMNRES
jgi:hypothetical protein